MVIASALPETREVVALRAQLIGRRDTLVEMLRERMGGVRHGRDDASAPDTETATEALLEAELALNLAELDREAAELEAINAALSRMDAGNYGTCIACAEPIGQARLTAYPAALHCVACETRLEQTAHRSG